MGRGLGERQREVLERLRELSDEYGGWVPLHRLADDPDDTDAMMRARSAVRGLAARGLVRTMRMTDEDRRVPTTVIVGEAGAGFAMGYTAEPSDRAWSGLHVRLLG
jgi:hypothetical protein